jgi:hypothetical protein
MTTKNTNTVLQILSDCYTNNKPFDYKLIPQEEWKKFTEDFDCDDSHINEAIKLLKQLVVDKPESNCNNDVEILERQQKKLLTNNPSKEDIFDFVYEAIGFHEFDAETICSFGNLSLALMSDYRAANFIIENKVSFKEFVRYKLDGKEYVKGIDVLPMEQIKFSDILFHFKGSFEDWQTDTSILDGSLLVSLCDYLDVKVETIDETPASWSVPEYEFEEFENREHLKKFSRLFSKPMNKWYGDRWCDA